MKQIGFLLLAGGTAAAALTTPVRAAGSLSVYLSEWQEEYYAGTLQRFREQYPEVEFTLESYSMNAPLGEQEKVKTEMMAGNGPDLLLFDSVGLDDVYKYLTAGAYAPLDAFLTEDNGWNSDDYVEAVMEAGRFDGTQYVIPLNFVTSAVLSSREALEEIGFDRSACRDTVSLMQETASLYEKEHTEQILTDTGLFGGFAQQLGGSFLDYDTGGISADPEDLRAACEAYCSLYEEDNYGTSYMDEGYYGFGVAILERKGYISVPGGIEMLLMPASAIAAEETPVLIPFCTKEGAAIASVRQYAGIRAGSENQQEAWNLLSLLLGEDAQRSAAQATSTVPVRKESIEADVREKYEAIQKEGGAEAPVGELSEEFLAQYLSLNENPGSAVFASRQANEFLQTMIPYFEGEEAYETCLEEFEDYIRIYLTE